MGRADAQGRTGVDAVRRRPCHPTTSEADATTPRRGDRRRVGFRQHRGACTCPRGCRHTDVRAGRAKEVNSGRTNRLAFTGGNTAGNLIVVSVLWDNPGGVTLTDTRGNAYVAAAPRTAWGSNWSATDVLREERRRGLQHGHGHVRNGRGQLGHRVPPRVLRDRPRQPARRDGDRRWIGCRPELWTGDHDGRRGPALRVRRVERSRDVRGIRLHDPFDGLRKPHDGPRRRERRDVLSHCDAQRRELGDADGGVPSRGRGASGHDGSDACRQVSAPTRSPRRR